MSNNYEQLPGIRRSDLWILNRSPLHFKHHIENPEPKTDALIFGAAVHKSILEPETFLDEYTIGPDVDRRTKAGREAWADSIAEALQKGTELITAKDLHTIVDMGAALEQNGLAMDLLTSGEHEKVFTWTDDVTGEKCKCKVDALGEYHGQPVIIDYKTTDSCEDGHFERSARKYGYDFQAGMYTEGVFQNTFEQYGFIFIAQEKTAPYASRIYVADPGWIAKGYDKFRELIGIYHYCKESGDWYGYEGPAGLPAELVEGM